MGGEKRTKGERSMSCEKEERRNQRDKRGQDDNPLKSLETRANVTLGALGGSRDLEGGDDEAAALTTTD